MRGVPRLRTERLVLRGFTEADREPFAAMNADPRVMEHFPGILDRAASDAFVDRILRRWEDDGVALWAVERIADSRFLGFTGLTPEPPDGPLGPVVEIGWRFVADAWGRGYATEAARAVLRFGFEALGLDEIQSWTVPANIASRRVMERIGMTHDPADDFDHPRHLASERLRRHVRYRLWRDDYARSSRPRSEADAEPRS
jgi:RimJ/RimL family protein N-acetyltransferase